MPNKRAYETCESCGIRLTQDNAGEASTSCDYCAHEPHVAHLSRVVPDPEADPEYREWLDAR